MSEIRQRIIENIKDAFGCVQCEMCCSDKEWNEVQQELDEVVNFINEQETQISVAKFELKRQHELRLKSESDWAKKEKQWTDEINKAWKSQSSEYAKELEHTIRLRDEQISMMVDRAWYTECVLLQSQLQILEGAMKLMAEKLDHEDCTYFGKDNEELDIISFYKQQASMTE